ncbi:MAG: hypothetical protein JRJ46_05445, partial [Deltaproteobacteria bacterium]|nr:hypothetical protein [Deltaproteobacteria bacterium]
YDIYWKSWDRRYKKVGFAYDRKGPVSGPVEKHCITFTKARVQQAAIDALSELLTTGGDDKTDKKIEKAIKHIEKSLAPELWGCGSTLTKKGKKVFDEDKKAVKELKKIIKDKDADENVKNTAFEAIGYLITANLGIASTAVDEAIEMAAEAGCNFEGKNDHECKKTLKEIDKALKEMDKAQKELYHTKKDDDPDPKYDKAIDHYKKAWEHAQHAMKKLSKPE